jgi:hypothetical protein
MPLVALQGIAASSIKMLLDALSKAPDSKTRYLISEILPHLSSAANSNIDDKERQTEAEQAAVQLKTLLEAGVIPGESRGVLDSVRQDLSAAIEENKQLTR